MRISPIFPALLTALAVSPCAAPTIALAATGAPVAPTVQTAPAGWKSFRNPIGLTFRYPDSWTLTDVNGLLLLVPPGGQTSGGSTPSEIYAVVGMPAPGVTRVDDPRLFQMADGFVAQSFPYMRRSGKGEAVKVGGLNGLIVTYDGTNPTTGQPSRIRSYAVVYKGMLFQLQAWGERDKVAARDDVLRQMFGSVKTGPSENDPQLFGDWAGATTSSGQTTRGLGGETRSSTSSESSGGFRMMPDGTLYTLTVTSGSVSVKSAVGTPDSQKVDSTSIIEGGPQIKKGRWYAGSGKIIVVMDDGTGLSADYRVSGRSLTVRFAGGASMQFSKR